MAQNASLTPAGANAVIVAAFGLNFQNGVTVYTYDPLGSFVASPGLPIGVNAYAASSAKTGHSEGM